jgi:hypothetical protein
LAEPVPLVGSGSGSAWRTLAWGKQKLSDSTGFSVKFQPVDIPGLVL